VTDGLTDAPDTTRASGWSGFEKSGSACTTGAILMRAKKYLAGHDIVLQQGLKEDLAGTWL
jgi:hypothetical protein